MALAPLDDVRQFVLGRVTPPEPVDVAIGEALGLVTAADIVATEPVPPFANSAMDGYAVRAADTEDATESAPVRLRVVGELPAGAAPERPVDPGEAIRIMTGAPIPDGADGIVIVEHTHVDGDEVVVAHPAGDHIRPAGGDVAVGDRVFAAGTHLGPAHLGVLASLGLPAVPVRPRARVAVASTGDELVGAGEPLRPGQIRESNRPMLLSLVAAAGAEPVDLGTLPDDPGVIEAALTEAASNCDVVITSGGVSMGEYDEVKVVLDSIGEMHWFQVAIKPAKPFAFGLVAGQSAGGLVAGQSAGGPGAGTPMLGLPGNPVSSFVSFEMFARPVLRRLMGHPQVHRPVHRAVAGEEMPRRADGKLHLDRVRVHAEPVESDGGSRGPAGSMRLVAVRSGGQASNVLTAMAHANALALLPDGDGVAAGEPLDVLLLDVPPTL